jgi:hypothetical protein
MEAYEVEIVEIPEQSDRTGSPRYSIRAGPMRGLKDLNCSATTIAGIELLRRIRKGQFGLRQFHRKNPTTQAIWNALLAA